MPSSSTFCRRHPVGSQAGCGDHAERPLAADKEAGQVGSRGRAWPGSVAGERARLHDCPVSEDDLEAGDDVLDLSVARVEYWPAPRQAIHPPTVASSTDWGQ